MHVSVSVTMACLTLAGYMCHHTDTGWTVQCLLPLNKSAFIEREHVIFNLYRPNICNPKLQQVGLFFNCCFKALSLVELEGATLTWRHRCNIRLNSVDISPPAEWVTMFETAGIDEATVLLQPLDDILVSILWKNTGGKKQLFY